MKRIYIFKAISLVEVNLIGPDGNDTRRHRNPAHYLSDLTDFQSTLFARARSPVS